MHQHNHNHDHGHSHSHTVKSFNTAFLVAVSATLIYTFAEAGYGVYAHSMALLADAVHNLGDALGLILAWVANWLLSFPARKRYSYGFKRTTIMAALANAFILVGTSAVIAYESFLKLQHLTPVNENVIIVVGLVGILVNGGASLLFMRGAEHDINIKGAYLHLLMDALILVGVVVSAVIIKYTGWVSVDPILGLIIVGIVLYSTWGLLRDSLHLIMDAIPHYIDHAGIKNYLEKIPGVAELHDLHIWGLSTREVALTVHLIMPNHTLTDADLKEMNHHLHHEFNVNHATIQVENGSKEHPCERSDGC